MSGADILSTIPVPDPRINPAIYYFLPAEKAKYQLEHIEDSKVTELLVSSIVCVIIAIVAVVLRFVSRHIKRSGYGLDDWLAVVALVLFSTFVAAVLACTHRYGAGRHLILSKDPILFAKLAMIAEALYAPSMGFVKLSTLVLYGRIFTFRGFRLMLWVIAALIASNSIANIFAITFQCNPVSGGWDPMVRLEAKCLDLNTAFIVISAFNVVTDVALLIMPLPHLWRLNVPWMTKIQLISLFAIGSFVSIVSIYRLPILNQLQLDDGSYSDVEPTVWTVIEISVATLCASAITYRPLFNKLFRIRASQEEPSAPSQEPPKRPARGFFTALIATKNDGGTIDVQMEKSTSDHSEGTKTDTIEEDRRSESGSQMQIMKSMATTVSVRQVGADDDLERGLTPPDACK